MKNNSSVLNYKSYKISLGNSEVIHNYDTRINLINESFLLQQLEDLRNNRSTTITLKMHSYKFSIFSFFILPLSILVSLIVSHVLVFKYKFKLLLTTSVLVIGLLIFQFIVVLISMRSQAIELDPYALNKGIQSIAVKIHNLFHIEFNFFVIMIIYLTCNFKSILLTLQSEKV
ncbi:MAG: hypothetical protein IT267_01520 [Saprospiraceae bacterium]|nr:hypothetical protein [Saprospiraceae bacterium]